MKAHTRTMLQLIIRLARGIIGAVEEWLQEESKA